MCVLIKPCYAIKTCLKLIALRRYGAADDVLIWPIEVAKKEAELYLLRCGKKKLLSLMKLVCVSIKLILLQRYTSVMHLSIYTIF